MYFLPDDRVDDAFLSRVLLHAKRDGRMDKTNALPAVLEANP
jgi:hypothetical protein